MQDLKPVLESLVAKEPGPVLHIVSGQCLEERFLGEGLVQGQEIVAFNEALCQGRVVGDFLSQEFIGERIRQLATDYSTYGEKVLGPMARLREGDFGLLILWFGDDMFCQVNMLGLLSYLEAWDYGGRIYLFLEDEARGVFDPQPRRINLGGYGRIYRQVFLEGQLLDSPELELSQRALETYLAYRDQASPLMKYIRANLHREDLVARLGENFPQYGLGDSQYQWLIGEVKGND